MIIEKKHFAYLVNQHGRVAHERGDFDRWKVAYEQSLQSIYDNIAPVLPARCGSILDVGSGLGGIDIHLHRHYGGGTRVVLLDGDNGDPNVVWSYAPHNSLSVGYDFLHKNGVTDVSGILPGYLHEWGGPPFDLVVSFAAYGFHIYPDLYLDHLRKVIHDDTVIILEVRRAKTDWLKVLGGAFGVPRVLEKAEKYARLAFRV
jgi:SAM-dependent methyltransferase